MSLLGQSAVIATITAISSAALTLALIHASIKLHLVAKSRTDRWHQRPTPNTGGIAIALSCIAVCALMVSGGRSRMVVTLGAAVALLGIVDDRLQLRPGLKLTGQAVAAGIAIANGVVFRSTRVELVDFAITFLWIIGLTNAFNLIDNMDGLCAGVTIIICLFRFLAAVQSDDVTGAFILAILAGGFLGFLIFNYKPAKIFMGDGGSMFAGFVLAIMAISSPVPHTRVFLSSLFCPALTFLYPIFDTTLVSVLRRLAGRPISVGGRDHSSHRLVSLGLSEQKVVWLLWGLAAAGGAVGLLTSWMPVGVIGIAVLLVLAVALFGIFLGSLPAAYDIPDSAPIRSRRIREVIPTLRAGIIIIVDTLLGGVALFCAFLLRWENLFLGPPLRAFLYSLPIVCSCHALACIVFRSFHCGWRWFGVRDFIVLAKCVVSGCALSVLAVWMSGVREYSRGVLLLYALLVLFFAVGMRVFMRLLSHMPVPPSGQQRVAVLGASSAGELAILIFQKQGVGALPVVVLETDPAANHLTIHGVPVRHAGANPLGVLRDAKVDMLIVPPNGRLAPPDHEVIEACEIAGLRVARLELLVSPVRERKGICNLVHAESVSRHATVLNST